jgi:hypothetical protein
MGEISGYFVHRLAEDCRAGGIIGRYAATMSSALKGTTVRR